MRYVSTRGEAPDLGFEDVLLTGLARDGGLYVPSHWPELLTRDLVQLQGKAYEDVAYAVMHPFIGGAIPEVRAQGDDRLGLCQLRPSGGGAPEAARRQSVAARTVPWAHAGLKDVAMQLLARLMDWALAKRRTRATIVGATSGDTGGAAIEAFKASRHATVFMLIPMAG